MLLRHPGGPVGAAVVDDQRGKLHTRDLTWDFVENGTKVACFVVRGYDHDQRLQLQVRVRSGESLLGGAGNPRRVGSLLQPVVGLGYRMWSHGHRWCVLVYGDVCLLIGDVRRQTLRPRWK